MEYKLDYQSLGKRIRKAREDNGLSQIELAKIIGIAPNSLTRAENNRLNLGLESIIKIANTLNVTMNYLLYDEISDIDIEFEKLMSKLTYNTKKLILSMMSAIENYENFS